MLMRMLARCHGSLTLGVLCVALCFRACALVSIILSSLDLHQYVVSFALMTGRVYHGLICHKRVMCYTICAT